MKTSIRRRLYEGAPLPKGEPQPPRSRHNALLTWRQVQMIRTLLGAGYQRAHIGRAFMVCANTIAGIAEGRTYRWVPERPEEGS